MLRKIDMQGIHGISGTPHTSGFRACGTKNRNKCRTAMETAMQAPSTNARGFPAGAKCQRSVKITAESEKQNKKDNVDHGLVVPIL